jgi:acetylornithine deacetylase
MPTSEAQSETALTSQQQHNILQAVDAMFDEQIQTTLDLVEIPSKRAEEELAQDFLENQYRQLGLDIDRWTIDSPQLRQHPGYGPSTVDYSKMTNLVGTYTPEQETGRSLILNGHVDVVPEGPEEHWSRSPWSAYVQDGWMYGRGAGDMKAGLIANLYAMKALQQSGYQLQGRVHLQSVVEEECTGNGSLSALLRGYKADAVIIPEPEEDALVRANVGVLWFRMRVSGQPTHPREMTEGFNAIDAAYHVIGQLRKLEEQWNAEQAQHRFFEDVHHPINFNIGEIRGGDWPSTVPAWCEVNVRVAIYPGVRVEDAWHQVQDCVEQAQRNTTGPQFDVELIANGFFAEGYVLEPGSDAENLLEQVHAEVFQQPLQTLTTPGYLDARVFINYADIPTLVYGPITENIHGFDERVSIESIRRCTKSIALFTAAWCGI